MGCICDDQDSEIPADVPRAEMEGYFLSRLVQQKHRFKCALKPLLSDRSSLVRLLCLLDMDYRKTLLKLSKDLDHNLHLYCFLATLDAKSR